LITNKQHQAQDKNLTTQHPFKVCLRSTTVLHRTFCSCENGLYWHCPIW
jgi:hypothetical protein